jgi:hypothetical protein
MSRSTSPSTGQTYGLVLVCRAWGLSRSTHYARKVATECTLGRRGPVGFHSDEELLGHIVACIQNSPLLAKATGKCGPGCVLRASEHPLCEHFDS